MDSSLSEWNGRGVRQRLGLIVGLQFNDSETNLQQEWKTIFGGISNVPWTSFAYYDKALQKWRWKELSIGDFSVNLVESNFELLSVEKSSNKIHSLLDELPCQSTFLLDIICVCNGWPVNSFPAQLYGAIRRAVSWHGAKVSLLSLESQVPRNIAQDYQIEILNLNMFCKAFTFDVFQPNTFWRGVVSLFDDSAKQFFEIPGFELAGEESNSITKVEELMSKGKRVLKVSDRKIYQSMLSHRLKVISKCEISSVPLFYFTSTKFSLRSRGSKHSSSVKSFLELCNSTQGLIVSLDYGTAKVSSFMDSCSDKSHKSSLTTEKWKKWVLHGMKKDEEPNLDEALSETPMEQIFFLVFDPGYLQNLMILKHKKTTLSEFSVNNSTDKTCILLDPSRSGVTRSLNLFQNTSTVRSSVSMPTIDSFSSKLDFNEFKKCFEEVQKKISLLMHNAKSLIDEEQFYQATLDLCSKLIMKKLGDTIFSKAESAAKAPPKEQEKVYVNESNWEERRFLSLVDHYKRLAVDRKLKLSRELDTTMKPSGDFVIMEAKELVKLFDKNGNPKPGSELQSLNLTEIKQNSGVNEDETIVTVSEPGSWPRILWSSFPDLYYLKDDQSEVRDRELSKIQQIYVGLRETVSTCNSQNSSKDSEVITKSLQTKQMTFLKNNTSQSITKSSEVTNRKQFKKSPTATQSRKSPRKLLASAKKASHSDKRHSQSVQKYLNHKPRRPMAHLQPNNSTHIKKLIRCAVFIALLERKINEASPIYNQCFKRLFDICKMYVKDIPSKIKTEEEVKNWLSLVSDQNADTVIKLVKSLR